MKRRNKTRRKSEKKEFWQSYSDMMAAILLIFAVALVGSILKSTDQFAEQTRKLAEQESELEALESAFLKKTAELDEKDDAYARESEVIAEKESEIDEQEKRLNAQIKLNAGLTQDLSERESELEYLKGQLEDRDTAISERTSEVTYYSDMLESEKAFRTTLQGQLDEANEKNGTLQDALDEVNEENGTLKGALESEKGAKAAAESELSGKEEELSNKTKALDEILGIRKSLVEELREEFSDTDLTVDAQTGSIIFSSDLMFERNSAVLEKSGESFLESFFPRYIEILMKDEYRDFISEIIIEGHADTRGTYMYNLELSQERAFAVAEFFLSDTEQLFGTEERDRLRKIITANGRSWSTPVLAADGSEDADASRRVEIKFRLKDEEMIRQMADVLGSQ